MNAPPLEVFVPVRVNKLEFVLVSEPVPLMVAAHDDAAGLAKSNAPLLTTSPVRAPLAELALPNRSVPLEMRVPPDQLLEPVRVRRPGPSLVSEPAPVIFAPAALV